MLKKEHEAAFTETIPHCFGVVFVGRDLAL